MGEIVNLRSVRKRAARDAAAKAADENRVRHGRTRTQREIGAREDERARLLLDGKRLSPDDPD